MAHLGLFSKSYTEKKRLVTYWNFWIILNENFWSTKYIKFKKMTMIWIFHSSLLNSTSWINEPTQAIFVYEHVTYFWWNVTLPPSKNHASIFIPSTTNSQGDIGTICHIYSTIIQMAKNSKSNFYLENL